MNLQDLILAADDAATDAAKKALAPAPVDQTAVDRIVASLPEKAAAAKKENPSAVDFVLYDGTGPGARRLVRAVCEVLAPVVDDQTTNGGEYQFVRVMFPYLERVAQGYRTKAWLDAVAAAWTGPTAPLYNSTGSSLTFSYGDIIHIAIVDISRKPADVVAEATKALRMPTWTVATLNEAWAGRPGSDKGSVTALPGRYVEGASPDAPAIYRGVECLMFAAAEFGSWSIDLDDARDLSAKELCDAAAEALKIDPGPVEVVPAVVEAEAVKAAPMVSKWDKKAAAKK